MFRVHSAWGSLACLLPALGMLAELGVRAATASEPSPGVMGVTLEDWEGRVLIKDLYVDGPAYAAGLRPGDRIIAVGHKAVNTAAELIEVMAEFSAADRIQLYASRDGWMKDLPITLATREDLAGKSLLRGTAETTRTTDTTPGRARSRRAPMQLSPPLTHPDVFHRKRYERW